MTLIDILKYTAPWLVETYWVLRSTRHMKASKLTARKSLITLREYIKIQNEYKRFKTQIQQRNNRHEH